MEELINELKNIPYNEGCELIKIAKGKYKRPSNYREWLKRLFRKK